ncbi:hypothetical protein D9M73_219270 [compost metagenome]
MTGLAGWPGMAYCASTRSAGQKWARPRTAITDSRPMVMMTAMDTAPPLIQTPGAPLLNQFFRETFFTDFSNA